MTQIQSYIRAIFLVKFLSRFKCLSLQNKEQETEDILWLECPGHLAIETDSSPSVVSMDIQTCSPLIHLGIIVTVE